jgi:hypothetical protein
LKNKLQMYKKFRFNPLKNNFLSKRKVKWVTVWKRANCFILLRFTTDFKQLHAAKVS